MTDMKYHKSFFQYFENGSKGHIGEQTESYHAAQLYKDYTPSSSNCFWVFSFDSFFPDSLFAGKPCLVEEKLSDELKNLHINEIHDIHGKCPVGQTDVAHDLLHFNSRKDAASSRPGSVVFQNYEPSR